MKLSLVAAVNIGGTNTRTGLIDAEGKIHNEKVFPTKDWNGPEDLVTEIWHFLKVAASALDAEISGLGIGAPNASSRTGYVLQAPNLNWKSAVPLASMFRDASGVNVKITNDANTAALGELYYGKDRSLKDFVFITLGTGLGSGIVCNGHLIEGHDGYGGEIGHTIFVQHGRHCKCGRRGCLEQYCSATGIVKTYREILVNNDHSGKGVEFNGSAEDIYQLALAGDEAAFYAFSYTGEMLGLALANVAACYGPETIFLGGGLAASGELLLHPVRISFEKNIFRIWKNKIQIRTPSLPDQNAALLGCEALIRYNL